MKLLDENCFQIHRQRDSIHSQSLFQVPQPNDHPSHNRNQRSEASYSCQSVPEPSYLPCHKSQQSVVLFGLF